MATSADLPYVDEHAVEVAADAAATWAALEAVVAPFANARQAALPSRLLGCEDAGGFHIEAGAAPGASLGEPGELILAGRHRFSRYALVFRVERCGERTSRLAAETRAEFPGAKGAVYRALVIGTRMHVLATRRILSTVRRRAERG